MPKKCKHESLETANLVFKYLNSRNPFQASNETNNTRCMFTRQYYLEMVLLISKVHANLSVSLFIP